MVDSSLPADSNSHDAPASQGEPSSQGEPFLQGEPSLQGEIARLIGEHHRALYRYAFRLAGRVADAEDLTQQTFVVAQQKIHQVRDPAKVRPWLYTVLRNCFLKSRRKQRPASAGDLELDIDAVAEPLPAAEQIDRRELQAAIDALPDEFKLVVVMFYFEECSYKEIAAKLEVPMGTVMSRLARAKGRLRRQLLADLVEDSHVEQGHVEDGHVEHAPHMKNGTPEKTETAKLASHSLKRPRVSGS